MYVSYTSGGFFFSRPQLQVIRRFGQNSQNMTYILVINPVEYICTYTLRAGTALIPYTGPLFVIQSLML